MTRAKRGSVEEGAVLEMMHVLAAAPTTEVLVGLWRQQIPRWTCCVLSARGWWRWPCLTEQMRAAVGGGLGVWKARRKKQGGRSKRIPSRSLFFGKKSIRPLLLAMNNSKRQRTADEERGTGWASSPCLYYAKELVVVAQLPARGIDYQGVQWPKQGGGVGQGQGSPPPHQIDRRLNDGCPKMPKGVFGGTGRAMGHG
jgi:hypothetical protein